MSYNEIIECLYDLKDPEKVIFKEKNLRPDLINRVPIPLVPNSAYKGHAQQKMVMFMTEKL